MASTMIDIVPGHAERRRRSSESESSGAPTGRMARLNISPRKPAHEAEEDAATAYSSWHDDGSSSQWSSCVASSCLACRGSRDAVELEAVDVGEGDDDVESQRSCRECRLVSRSFESLLSDSTQGEAYGPLARRLPGSSSSSYYSAVSAQADEPEDGQLVGAFSFELGPALQYSKSELTESTVSIEDKLEELTERAHHLLTREQSSTSDMSGYSCQDDPSHSSIDATCRARMLEWSFKVLEFSFPCESSERPTARRRKYSTETLQIISQSFLLIDRLASKHLHQENGRPMDRSTYKLTCMVCLHLVAKTSGLFALYESEQERAAEEGQLPCSDTAHPSPTSPSGLQGHDTPCHEGQAMLSMPKLHPPSAGKPQRCSRPALALLSLQGLVALCKSECTVARLVEVERRVLQQLDWRISGATSIDWCELLLDMLAVCADACDANIDLEEVRECALACLERATEAGSAVAPSTAAWSAVSYALEECRESKHEALASMYKGRVQDILLCY
ncbi:hypothetical protein ACHAXT_012326 [Thalassiosira profunda]